ncbi:DnaJ C-terminal domain-containing protein [Nostoc sp. CENA543]|nr:DnaJ C-terminal domain-containing protein [Nostoc sp. CENA543]
MRKIKIAIPLHSVAGDRLTIAGEGNAGRRGGESGDLYIDLDINS